jgi:hypothetical protein
VNYKGNSELWDRLDRAENRVQELEEYADKLAAGLPEGMLPADVENLRTANANMAQKIHELKARCTWKRALEVQPPLEKSLIVKCYFQGIIKAWFETVDGKLYYHKPHENYWSPVTNETYWIEMPDMPEVKS